MFDFPLTLQDDPLQHRLVPLQGKIPTVGGRLPIHYSFHASWFALKGSCTQQITPHITVQSDLQELTLTAW